MIDLRWMIFLLFSLFGCTGERTPFPKDWQELKESGEIRILTRNAATTTFYDRDGVLAGPDYQLASAFAKAHGLEPLFIFEDSVGPLLDELSKGEAEFAAAGLTITEQRKKNFLFTKAIQKVQHDVVCHKKVNVNDLEDFLKTDVVVLKKSSYVDNLEKLKKDHPEFKFKTVAKSTEQLLEMVWEREVDCTIADSHIVKLHQRYFPELQVKLTLDREKQLAWAIPKRLEFLKKKIDEWLSSSEGKQNVAAILSQYYEGTPKFDYYDIKVFLRRIEDRLPKYRGLFERMAEKYDLPWTLLAAVSYQESHWNPKAKSPTGVRGLMMLTKNTAKAMGVKNRLDPEESVEGGAKYLVKMMNKSPAYLDRGDRLYFALASYNVGYYHLLDARSLAIWKKQNPNDWDGVKDVLPLLSKRKYYRKLRYGYARGLEPVMYVQRIKQYRDILENKLGIKPG